MDKLTMLRRGDGTVWTLSYGVSFPMQDLNSRSVVCILTRAGFRRVLARNDFTQEELRELFRLHRARFEDLATLLYEATQQGDTQFYFERDERRAVGE